MGNNTWVMMRVHNWIDENIDALYVHFKEHNDVVFQRDNEQNKIKSAAQAIISLDK